MGSTADSAQALLRRFQRRSFIIGLVGVVLCGVGGVFSPEQFFRSYLVAYLFWMGMPLGCLAITMLHELTGGGWGDVIRRLLESGTRTFPLLVLFFLPLVVGLPHLYVWARPEAVAGDELLQHKRAYLNVPFFLVRATVYFTVWGGVAYLLERWSRAQDALPRADLLRRSRLLSGPGLVLYGVAVTFASIDWVMSLEPHWSSTVYALLNMVGQGLMALALMIAAAAVLAEHRPLVEVITPGHFHDLGNLLLTLVLLWAYLAFSQYLIIWSANLPEEIPWYLRRSQNGWAWVGLAVIVCYFVLPFLLLLSRDLKRNARALAWLAVAVIILSFMDLWWRVTPAFHASAWHVHWMDVATPIGLGGLWLATFAWQLQRRPLVPRDDPSLQEALRRAHE